MADIVVNQGLNDMLDQWTNFTNDPIDAIGVSNFGTLLSTTTTIAAAVFEDINAINSATAASSQTTLITADFTSAEITGNNITTITFHNDGAGASTGVQGGVDAQNLTFSGVDIQVRFTIGAASA